MRMREKFLRDQPEGALLSEAAVGKTSTMMRVSENPRNSRFWKLGSAKCGGTNPRLQPYLTN